MQISKNILSNSTAGTSTLAEERSFDAWGRLRNPTNWSYTSVPAMSLTYRGFTGHEHLLAYNIINMNGRVYDPVVARFMSPDNYIQAPNNTQSFNRYSYVLNNPLKYTDPTGWYVSTHIDEDGNVLAVVKDGDKGVYMHGRNADGNTPTEYQIKKRQERKGSSAGGEKVGETWTELGFADFEAYLKDGIVRPADGAKIELNSTWATEQVSAILNSNPTLAEYAYKARGGEAWDIKSQTDNSMSGSLLFGKYASARDAGNFAAGAVAQSSIMPNSFSDYGFGTYNESKNSVIKSMKVIAKDLGNVLSLSPAQRVTGFSSIASKIVAGEHPLSQAGINAGKSYILNLRR